MAMFSTIALATAAVASTGMGVAKSIKGAKMEKEYMQQLKEYERAEIPNVYANLAVPTEAFEAGREFIAAQTAASVEELSRAGARGLVGGLPGVVDYSTRALEQIGAEFEQTKFNLKKLIAEDEKRRQAIISGREEADIAGLGQAIEAGRQQKYAGIGEAIQGGIGLAQTMAGTQFGEGGELLSEADRIAQAGRVGAQELAYSPEAPRTTLTEPTIQAPVFTPMRNR
jgi:hypothetical protein